MVKNLAKRSPSDPKGRFRLEKSMYKRGGELILRVFKFECDRFERFLTIY